MIRLLRTAVAHDRVPQSLLFAGSEGVGKRAVAIALAQAVNCPNRMSTLVGAGVSRPASGGRKPAPTSEDACGICPTCLRIARGQHTDVTVIDKGDEASIKIKVLRERLLEFAGYRPFESRRRVFIIDPADEMTIEAQDALLKTLEEPTSGTMIVLISAYADTLLPTIQSRCRRLRFGLLSDADVARVLVERCAVEPARARLMAASAGGSVSRALAEEAGELAEDRDAALALLQASASRTVPVRLKAAAALAKNESKRRDREALGARLGLLASLCRDVTALQTGAGSAIVNTDLAADLQALTRAFPTERLSRAYASIERAQQALERNASPKIVADWVGVTI